MCEIAGSTEGTVFPTSINDTKINALFDTGATKSVMSGEMYKRLKLGPLDTTRLPKVVGADGTSLGAMGRICCEINIGDRTFKQTLLVCQNITRPSHFPEKHGQFCSRITIFEIFLKLNPMKIKLVKIASKYKMNKNLSNDTQNVGLQEYLGLYKIFLKKF